MRLSPRRRRTTFERQQGSEVHKIGKHLSLRNDCSEALSDAAFLRHGRKIKTQASLQSSTGLHVPHDILPVRTTLDTFACIPRSPILTR